MVNSSNVILVGGLHLFGPVFNAMRSILLIAADMGKKPGDFSVMTHRLITRDLLEISPVPDYRDWAQQDGMLPLLGLEKLGRKRKYKNE